MSRRVASPARVLLEHARLRWSAEVENAHQMSARENGLITVCIAVLGIGLPNTDAINTVEPSSLRAILWIVAGLVVVALIMALHEGLRIRPNPEIRGIDKGRVQYSYSSGYLRWPDGYDPLTATETKALELAHDRTNLAATALYNDNLVRAIRLNACQQYLFIAAVLAAMALIAGMVLGEPQQGTGLTKISETPSETQPPIEPK
jgi:hypothetical protein